MYFIQNSEYYRGSVNGAIKRSGSIQSETLLDKQTNYGCLLRLTRVKWKTQIFCFWVMTPGAVCLKHSNPTTKSLATTQEISHKYLYTLNC